MNEGSGPALRVSFVLAGEADLAALASLDPERDHAAFNCGERCWVLQTYCRLNAAGASVELRLDLPEDGLAVFSTKQRHRLRRARRRAPQAILVSCREDVGATPYADFEIVQNPCQARGPRRVWIPHWPQPGLVPRDSGRGGSISTVVYKGLVENLHAELRAPSWSARLAERGFEWRIGGANYAGAATDASAWADYREADVVVAVRPPDRGLHVRKPQSKLTNAWLAGVPAVLGPELAYRSLRRSALDYIEARNAEEVLAALERLRADPQLHAAMAANGLARAAEFGAEAVAARWRAALFGELPQRTADPGFPRFRSERFWVRSLTRALRVGL